MTDYRVLITEPIADPGPELLATFATITCGSDYQDREALLADVATVDAVIVRTFPVDETFLGRAQNLDVVVKHGVGFDNIDVATATAHEVPVCRVTDVNSRAVAEHALALLLAIRKRLLFLDRSVRSGSWNRQAAETRTLAGDVVGLFGCGSIGTDLAARLAGLDVSCLAYDPYLDAEDAPANVTLVTDKIALFDRADAVSVHTPLTPETAGAIGTSELRALGDTGIVVNTARGGIIEEAALVDALERGDIDGAGLDVFADEPPPVDHPLFDHDRVVLTPHVAGNTNESLAALSRGAAEHVRTVYEGDLPDATVNASALDNYQL